MKGFFVHKRWNGAWIQTNYLPLYAKSAKKALKKYFIYANLDLNAVRAEQGCFDGDWNVVSDRGKSKYFKTKI